MSILAPKLRLVRPAPDPLGLYVRAGSIGREDLRNFIMSNGATFSGVVFEAKRVSTQKELLSLVLLIGDHVQLRRAPPPHPNPLPRVQGRGSPCWLPRPLAGEGWGEGGALAEHGR